MTPWWKQSLRLALRHRAGLLCIGALSLLSIGFNLLLPWPTKLIVDNVLSGKATVGERLLGQGDKFEQLLWLAAASAVLFLAARLAEMVRVQIAAMWMGI